MAGLGAKVEGGPATEHPARRVGREFVEPFVEMGEVILRHQRCPVAGPG